MQSDMHLIRERKPHLSPHSYATYRQSLKRLYKVSPTLDLAAIKEYVYGLKNVAVARNLLTPLLILRKPGARDVFDDLANRYNDYVTNQKPSPLQHKNVTTLRDLKRMLRRMREDVHTHKLLQRADLLNRRERRLLVAYVSYAILLELPMRSNLADLVVVQNENQTTDDKRTNYYVLSQNKIYLNNFKTRRAFARRDKLPLKLSLSRPTAKLVRDFYDTHKHKHLLQNINKQTHNNILLSQSYRYLGVRVGVTMLRHVVLSDFVRGNPSLRERKEMMRKMQQINLETQMSYAFRED